MRPSTSVTLEPSLERGVPWGRDLYTFVTSAAGHMMRTLQKPRKNRPSKRQVNHRRFLHNMIQRKFADIEAANQQLASALYSKEEGKNASSPKLKTPDRSDGPTLDGYRDPDPCKVHTDSEYSSDMLISSHENEIREKRGPDSGQRPQSTSCTSRENSQVAERQNHHEPAEVSINKDLNGVHGEEIMHTLYYENLNFLQDSRTLHEPSSIQTSPPFTPELSPLSLHSCDFAIQMFADSSTCTPAQKNMADIAESQWTDIMDLFSDCSKDLDVEAYLESICECKDVRGGEDVFVDQDGHYSGTVCRKRPEDEDLICERDQGLIINCFQRDQSTNEDTEERQLNFFKPFQFNDIQNQLPASISYNYNKSETFQHPHSPHLLADCENNLNFSPFEGVAQSFSAPPNDSDHRPIATPPHEDDWLFNDILKEGKTLDC